MSGNNHVFNHVFCYDVNETIALNECLCQVFNQKLKSYTEKAKTPDEISVILAINAQMKEFVKSYGGQHVDINEGHVFNIDTSKLKRADWYTLRAELDEFVTNGFYLISEQSIRILLLCHEDIVNFAKLFVHELIHMNGFQSLYMRRAVENKLEQAELLMQKMGFCVYGSYTRDDDIVNVYFNGLEEAVTEELSNRFADLYFASLTELDSGMQFRENCNCRNADSHITDIVVSTWQKKKGLWTTQVVNHSVYPKERQYLKDLIEKIHISKNNPYKSREEIFEVFARVHFTGNFVPFTKLVRKCLGKGQLRKIAQDTKIEVNKKLIIFSIDDVLIKIDKQHI